MGELTIAGDGAAAQRRDAWKRTETDSSASLRAPLRRTLRRPISAWLPSLRPRCGELSCPNQLLSEANTQNRRLTPKSGIMYNIPRFLRECRFWGLQRVLASSGSRVSSFMAFNVSSVANDMFDSIKLIDLFYFCIIVIFKITVPQMLPVMYIGLGKKKATIVFFQVQHWGRVMLLISLVIPVSSLTIDSGNWTKSIWSGHLAYPQRWQTVLDCVMWIKLAQQHHFAWIPSPSINTIARYQGTYCWPASLSTATTRTDTGRLIQFFQNLEIRCNL